MTSPSVDITSAFHQLGADFTWLSSSKDSLAIAPAETTSSLRNAILAWKSSAMASSASSVSKLAIASPRNKLFSLLPTASLRQAWVAASAFLSAAS